MRNAGELVEPRLGLFEGLMKVSEFWITGTTIIDIINNVVVMTNGDIERLGKRIGTSNTVSSDDLEMLQKYRETFQIPISHVFNFILDAARKIDKSSIVTFRIKRIDTIVEKLHRFYQDPNGKMKLSRMWDIAGCRCIMHSPDSEKLYQLLEVIENEYGPDIKIKDSVEESKPSGYRSLHVYVKDKQTQKHVEIQIRNVEQHNWATLVEIVDLLYGTKNKEYGAYNTLGRFLYLYSHASDLEEEDFVEMLRIERRMKIFEMMSNVLTGNYLNIRRQWLKQKQRGCYFVITANKGGSEIISFQSFDDAETAYYEKYLTNRDSNIVLTHLKMPDLEQISMAYSNYVLAMHAFLDDYRILVSKRMIQWLREGAYYKFMKYSRFYNSNVKCHFENLCIETNVLESCMNDPEIPRHQLMKWLKEIKQRLQLWSKETNDLFYSFAREIKGRRIIKWLVMSRARRLAKAVSEGQRSLRK